MAFSPGTAHVVGRLESRNRLRSGCQRCVSRRDAQLGEGAALVCSRWYSWGGTAGLVLSENLPHEERFGEARRGVAFDATQAEQRPERLLVEPLPRGL